jgi:hypothetical protein
MARQLTVIEAVSQALLEIGITQKPVGQAIGSNDQDIAQTVALLSAVADDVMSESPYEEALADGYWLVSADGGTFRAYPVQDDDRILFDGRLAIYGLKYRFLHAKSLEFGEQLRDFTAKQSALAAKANARVLDLDADEGRVQ